LERRWVSSWGRDKFRVRILLELLEVSHDHSSLRLTPDVGVKEVNMKNWGKLVYVGIGVVAGYYGVKHFFVTGGRVI
jgi:hypothetical protein